MVAAAALGDVVEERGHHQDPGLVPAGSQLGAERVFVGVFGDEEAPHVAQHHQDVLIHRVHVEQACCIWPTMRRNTHSSGPVPMSCHEAQRVRDAARRLSMARKGRGLTGSLRNRASITCRALYSARSVAGRQAISANRRLVQQEVSRIACGFSSVQVVAGDLDLPALLKKRSFDRLRAWPRGSGVRRCSAADLVSGVTAWRPIKRFITLAAREAVRPVTGSTTVRSRTTRPPRSAGRTPAGPRARGHDVRRARIGLAAPR